MSQIEVDKIIPQSGTSTQLGESGDTITIPAGATITNNGTANGFGSADTEKVKVSSNDTTAGFLNGKLVAGTNISLTEGSDGGNETLTAALSGTIATAQITDDAITLAKMAPGTDGNLITYDTSGNPAAVATGSAGQILTSAGAGAVPSFQAAPGGGKVLQVVNLYKGNGNVTTTSTSFVDVSGMTLNITPAATSSKIYLQLLTNMYQTTNGAYFSLRYTRTIGSTTSNLVDGTYGLVAARANTDHTFWGGVSMQFLDSPNTTSQTTYKIQFRNDGGTATFGLNGMPSNMVAIEIGA